MAGPRTHRRGAGTGARRQRLGGIAANLSRALALPVPTAAPFASASCATAYSFDGLLVRARNLVRDQHRVRPTKKIVPDDLIDEFQDTDPIQYEILLYLAEQAHQSASEWRKVKLEPGKCSSSAIQNNRSTLFGALISKRTWKSSRNHHGQDGIESRSPPLRSDGAILDVVNGAFEELIQPKPDTAAYIGIEPAPGRTSLSGGLAKVSVRKNCRDDQHDAKPPGGSKARAWRNCFKESVLGLKRRFSTARPDCLRRPEGCSRS